MPVRRGSRREGTMKIEIDGVEYAPGQIWVDRRNKPRSAFTILQIYEKNYKDGTKTFRFEGVLSCGESGVLTHMRHLDYRSVRSMFPVVKFNPPKPETDEEDI